MTCTTTTGLPLPLTCAPAHRDRREELLSYLGAGWVVLAYRKSNGERVERLATRNPSILKAYATAYEMTAIRDNDPDRDRLPTVLYYDYSAGTLRSFRVDSVLGAYIPHSAPEFNH